MWYRMLTSSLLLLMIPLLSQSQYWRAERLLPPNCPPGLSLFPSTVSHFNPVQGNFVALTPSVSCAWDDQHDHNDHKGYGKMAFTLCIIWEKAQLEANRPNLWCLRVLCRLKDIDMEKKKKNSAGFDIAIVQLLMVWQSRIVVERFPGSLGRINAEEHSASHMVLVKPPMKSGDW